MPTPNALHRKVSFTTTNLDNGEIFDEPYFVNGPTPKGAFNIPLNAITIAGNKVVIPLQSSTSWGSYWLKIWLPQPGSKDMYITFCQKNYNAVDKYYDYQNGIPSSYRTALRTWIRDNPQSANISTQTYPKTLVFTSYGLDTNKVSSGVQFYVTFTAIFDGISVSPSSAADATIRTVI